MLKKVTDALRRILNPQAVVDIELGYLNEDGLRRNPEGFHILATFIEQSSLGADFATYRTRRHGEIKAKEEAEKAKKSA